MIVDCVRFSRCANQSASGGIRGITLNYLDRSRKIPLFISTWVLGDVLQNINPPSFNQVCIVLNNHLPPSDMRSLHIKAKTDTAYASANDKQAAMDGYKGNGLFTYTLLDGLNNNKAADKYKDGKVSIVGLGEYARKMTTTISKQIGHEQTPLIINFGKDSPLYKLQ